MSIKLNWEIDEDEIEPGEVKERQLPFSSIIGILTVLVLALVAFGVWQVGQKRPPKPKKISATRFKPSSTANVRPCSTTMASFS